MRLASVWILFLLAGCGGTGRTATSICEMGDGFRGWEGTKMQFEAMLVAGNMEGPPLVVDQRCWRGIPADTSNDAQFEQAFGTDGRFNRFARVSGRIVSGVKGIAWFRITSLDRLSVMSGMTAEQEDSFQDKMTREANEYRLTRHAQVP